MVSDNLIENPLRIHVVSSRKYGDPKLKKPKELSKIKQIGSADFIPKKCACQVFVVGNDIWIKHRDFFSPIFQGSDDEDIGAPVSVTVKKYFGHKAAEKFVYPDNYGCIVFRSEAWLCLPDAMLYQERIAWTYGLYGSPQYMHNFAFDAARATAELIGVNWTELDTTWERFWERVGKLVNI